jgi:hypothetical protein
LSVHHRTFTPAKRHSNKRVSHHFEVVDGQFVQAKKEVFFVLGGSQIVFGKDNQPVEAVTTERKMYERAVKPEDCSELLEFLGRSARWARVAKK